MNTDIDAAWSFRRYQEILPRLPRAVFPTKSHEVSDLGDLAAQFDAFVFDAFGVLNVGETTIPSAIDRVMTLRAMAKQVRVLTNAASLQAQATYDKFAALGYDFSVQEIVSSRKVLIDMLSKRQLTGLWGCIVPDGGLFDDLPINTAAFDPAREDFSGVIFLKGAGWSHEKNNGLISWFKGHSVPFLIGNPDLVAPRGDWFSLEPGTYAHDVADATTISLEFFGKPFGNAFDAVAASLASEIPRDRILMVGDTLHTDILGGAAAGFKTCLVTGHGVLRDLDHHACIEESGIVPDFILPTI
jgi:glycerol 3-phosphatase-2